MNQKLVIQEKLKKRTFKTQSCKIKRPKKSKNRERFLQCLKLQCEASKPQNIHTIRTKMHKITHANIRNYIYFYIHLHMNVCVYTCIYTVAKTETKVQFLNQIKRPRRKKAKNLLIEIWEKPGSPAIEALKPRKNTVVKLFCHGDKGHTTDSWFSLFLQLTWTLLH